MDDFQFPYDSDDENLDDSDDDYIPDYVSQNSAESDDTSSEYSSEDEVPLQQLVQKTGKKKYSWKRTEQQESVPLPNFESNVNDDTEEIGRPIHYFEQYFSDEVLDHIVFQSNLYSVQKNKPLKMTKDELQIFIGTVIYMSIYGLPRHRMYWAQATRVNQVCDVISRKRWEEIKMNLHFNNNADMPQRDDPNRDKLFKIRPFIDLLLNSFQNQEKPRSFCVDEQIVPFKGRSGIKQYNPKKPNKWGYKIFVLSDETGLIHNFEIYTGKVENAPGKADVGASGNSVLRLAQIIPKHKGHLLYFDNWFSSIELMLQLSNDGIGCLGTIRTNRFPGLQFRADKDMKRDGRGSFEEQKVKIDGMEIRAVKWFDNKAVHLASTFCGAYPTDSVKRFDRKSKTNIEIERPFMVKIYNQFMGGVDLIDGLISYHRITRRSKKYYLRFFFHFIDMALVCSWLNYKKDMTKEGLKKNDILDLLGFRSEVAEALCLLNKVANKKRGRPSSSSIDREFEEKKRRGPAKPIPQFDVRNDGVGHWPVDKETRQRCKHPSCGQKTFHFCVKCQAYLCINKKRNCFAMFHGAH